MKKKLVLKVEDTPLLDDILEANDFKSRLMGYMFQRAPRSKGILFRRCNSLHSYQMHFDLDLFFLNAHGEILHIERSFPKNKQIHIKKATQVLEVPSGLLPNGSVEVGMVMQFF